MSHHTMRAFQSVDLVAANAGRGTRYTEFLRVPAMSAGIYALPAGGEDLQKPHAQDEIYYVMRGRSKFVCDGEVIDARPGSFIYVAAGADHRFFDIDEDLEIIVLFAPEERPD
jgi:mannose-6-phosphate isomerase-like protein (cupin superfamily)